MVNWIIGQGESLVQTVNLATGGGEKVFPYTYDETIDRISGQLDETASAIERLPSLACPDDEAVVAITLHPAFLAKSYHPSNLLTTFGLRQVGSRATAFMPEHVTSTRRSGEEFMSSELFIAGTRKRLVGFTQAARSLSIPRVVADDIRKIERVRPLGNERIKRVSDTAGLQPLEVVLHADTNQEWGNRVLSGFAKWCKSIGINPELDRRQQVGGLSFLGMYAEADQLDELVEFAFMRAVRRMAKLSLRDLPFRATDLGSLSLAPKLNEDAISDEVKVAIFDGGLPSDHPFGSLVNRRKAHGIGKSVKSATDHGCQVTSALLYGSITDDTPSIKPYSKIDHWRVIDDEADDFELLNTLDRIATILSQHSYKVINLSIGPDEAIIDDDVHAWTARLDQLAANGQILIICAAGNNGQLDEELGLCRIQPPGDGVNLLAVGAADSASSTWSKAKYSATGPGRSPGYVKPDVVSFGGSTKEPFLAISAKNTVDGISGTSFSAPAVSRLAVGLDTIFGDQVKATTAKALIIHNAEPENHHRSQVGWGRVPYSLADLTTCGDDEATVIYQGLLEPSRFMRFPLPVPRGGFEKSVNMRATFVFASNVDPEDSVSYTRTGVGITFRPSTMGHPGVNKDGKERSNHQSKTFFGKADFFQTEQELRDDALRWETVLKAEQSFRSTTLRRPVFDIEHLTRAHGHNTERSTTIPYALVVTIREAGNKSFYNEIIRSYGGRLTAMVPQIEIDINNPGR